MSNQDRERERFEAALDGRRGPTGDVPGYPGPRAMYSDEKKCAWWGWQAALSAGQATEPAGENIELLRLAAKKTRDWLGSNCVGEPPRPHIALLGALAESVGAAGQVIPEPPAAAMVVAGRIDPMFGFDVLSNDGELLYLRSPEQTGWKLAPIEPTDDMAVAGQEAWLVCRTERPAVEDCEEARNVYRAMLLAAPTLGDQG